MNITHLVVNGCSWTYCQGLDNPREQGWPALLAKKLNVPVVNLAVPGSGNDAIHRRTYEYFFEDLPNNSKPLYIIAWSQLWRREIWNKDYYLPKNGYSAIRLPNGKPENHAEYALLDTWSNEDINRRTMLYRLSLDSLFKSKQTPYLASFFADPIGHRKSSLVTKFPNTYDYLKGTPITDQMLYEITNDGQPKLPCGHDNAITQVAIAEYLYNFLLKEHGEITPVDGKFMTLLEYSKINAYPNTPIDTTWF